MVTMTSVKITSVCKLIQIRFQRYLCLLITTNAIAILSGCFNFNLVHYNIDRNIVSLPEDDPLLASSLGPIHN